MPDTIHARIKNRHDTTANWALQTTFIPYAGEMVIYDDYSSKDGVNVPGIKIGDGIHLLSELPFITKGSSSDDAVPKDLSSFRIADDTGTSFRNSANVYVNSGSNSFRMSLSQLKAMNTKIVSVDSLGDINFNVLTQDDFIYEKKQ